MYYIKTALFILYIKYEKILLILFFSTFGFQGCSTYGLDGQVLYIYEKPSLKISNKIKTVREVNTINTLKVDNTIYHKK